MYVRVIMIMIVAQMSELLPPQRCPGRSPPFRGGPRQRFARGYNNLCNIKKKP